MSHRDRPLEVRLFRAALRVAPARRHDFVGRYASAPPEVRCEVLADLEAFATQDDRFDTPAGRSTLIGRATSAAAPLRAEDLVGSTVGGRYRLGDPIGRGASGAVFAATDLDGEGDFAIKVFRCADAATATAVRREIATMRGLAVPGVVALLDEGEEGDHTFLVMPRLAGAPFPGRRRDVDGRVPWEALRRPAVGLLETLARVHDLGVVHRDVKPTNVLVDDAGIATLLDVGASGGAEGAFGDDTIAGTLGWMAPEQERGDVATVRSDLYAYGLLVLTALSGLRETTLRARTDAHGRLPPLATLVAGAPAALVLALERLLDPEPARRFASAHEALAAIGVPPVDVGTALGLAPDREGPLAELELRALFHGPVRVMHLPDDAAHELHARTGGELVAVASTLASWERAGLVRRDGGRYVVTRASLARLAQLPAEATLPGGPPPLPLAALDARAQAAATWAGPGATAAVLAPVLHTTADVAGLHLASLRERGRLRTGDGDRHVALGGVDAARWPRAAQDALRADLVAALPPGAPGRLWNLTLLPTTTDAELVDEALARDRVDVEARRAGLALAARTLRRRGVDRRLRARTLLALLATSIGTNDVAAMSAALREIELAADGPDVAPLRAIGRAAIWAVEGQAREALRTLGALDPDDPHLVYQVLRVRAQAARALPEREELALLDRAVAWAQAHPDVATEYAWRHWIAWARYRHDRFLDAARELERAADVAPTASTRAAALAGAAEAWAQVHTHGTDARRLSGAPAPALDAAIAAAERGLRALGALRLPAVELDLLAAARAARYRREDPTLVADEALADAADALGSPARSAAPILTEAAVAWRGGASALAARLAARARDLLRRTGRADFAAMAAAFAAFCAGAPLDAATAAALERELVRARRPGARLQGLALLGAVFPPLRSTAADAVRDAAALLGDDVHDRRREILSPREALALVTSSPPLDGPSSLENSG